MPNARVDADYSKYQVELLTDLTAVPQAFPPVVAPVTKPEKILVQAHPQNDGNVIVGQDPNLADPEPVGYFLGAGQMQVLSGRDVTVWKARGTGTGGQKLIVTYLSGAN